MIIWLALLMPLMVVLGMFFLYRRQCAWWEYTLPVVATFIVITICKLASDTVQTHDTEYWGGYITHGSYYEPWDEEVPCTHAKYRTETRTRSVSDGKGGFTTETYTEEVFDGWQHPYDVSNHGPEWDVHDNNGFSWNVSEQEWERIAKLFEHREFRDMHRDYHSIDGDAYDTVWNRKYETIVVTTTTHSYENRIQASNSVFNYRKIENPQKLGLYEYAKGGIFDTPSVLPTGYAGSDDIEKLNALLGKEKEVRVWVLVFKNKTREIAKLQEAYWKGGNKNELVLCVGVDDQQAVQWAEVFSWSKSEDLKVEVRTWLEQQKTLDLTELAAWLTPQIKDRWTRRNWHDFDYLTVEPPTWMVMLTFVLALGVSIGVGFYAVQNEFDSEGINLPRRFPPPRPY